MRGKALSAFFGSVFALQTKSGKNCNNKFIIRTWTWCKKCSSALLLFDNFNYVSEALLSYEIQSVSNSPISKFWEALLLPFQFWTDSAQQQQHQLLKLNLHRIYQINWVMLRFVKFLSPSFQTVNLHTINILFRFHSCMHHESLSVVACLLVK